MIDNFNVNIREAKIEDIPVIVDFARIEFTRTFGHLYPIEQLNNFLNENYTIEKYNEFIHDKTSNIIIAITNDNIIKGYILACRCHLPHEDVIKEIDMEIKRLYIHPDLFGKDIGNRLVQEIYLWMKSICLNKSTRVWLGVWEENYRAQKFYNKLGYRKAGEYVYVVGDCRDVDFILNKNLY